MASARLPTRKIAACVFGLLLALTACLYSTWDPDAPYKYPGPENNKAARWNSGDCSREGQLAAPSEGPVNDSVGGTCGRRAWAAGGGQRVVSLSLYGNRAEYWLGLDTLLTQISSREAAAVEQWLASNKTFHVMRDHPQHDTTILGGMWGARWDNLPAPRVAELAQVCRRMLDQGRGRSHRDVDQEILDRVMWPVAKGRVVSHDSFFCQKYPPSVPWPTQREAGFFVGAPSLRPEYSKSSLTQPCPEACRPPRHKDWTFC